MNTAFGYLSSYDILDTYITRVRFCTIGLQTPVSNKVWNKLVKAAEEWPAWTAALSGTMGQHTEKGFTLAGPGLQVFERKPKVPAEAASPLAAALSAALTATRPVETAPAPTVADSAESVSVPPATATAEPDAARRKPVLSLRNRQATS